MKSHNNSKQMPLFRYLKLLLAVQIYNKWNKSFDDKLPFLICSQRIKAALTTQYIFQAYNRKDV